MRNRREKIVSAGFAENKAVCDPLRLIRAAVEEGFTGYGISRGDLEMVRRVARELANTDGKEIREAIEEILMLKDPRVELEWLCRSGVMEAVLPEVYGTVQFSQEADRRHKDVWEHTKQVVFQTERRPAVRWAALLHDIGKVETRTFTPDGRVQFLGHAEKGAAMFRKVSNRLEFPKQLSVKVHFLILKHLRANQYSAQWNDSAVRRFYRQAGEHFDDLLALSMGDITTARPGRKREALDGLRELRERVEALKKEDAKKPPLPSGLGNHLIEHFKLEPGRIIGKIRAFLERRIGEKDLEPGLSSEEYILYLEKTRSAWDETMKRPQEAAVE